MRFFIYFLLLLLVFGVNLQACKSDKQNKQKPIEVATDTLPAQTQQQAFVVKRTPISQVLEELPPEFLTSEMFGEVTADFKHKLLSGSFAKDKLFRDILIDSSNYYLFFDRQQAKRGTLIALSTFPYPSARSELIMLEISQWSDKRVETENLFFFKRNQAGGWEEIPLREIVPAIHLQDFYNSDVAGKIQEADHNYLPVLCYERERGSESVKVFLGEWFHGKEQFAYKPDIDFVELQWQDGKFDLKR